MYAYEKFIEIVETRLQLKLKDPVQVQVNSFKKNNGITQKGLHITKEGMPISPVIYLNLYYEQYQNGHMTMDEVIKDICRIGCSNFISGNKESLQLMKFEMVKEKLRFKVVNKAANLELLEDVIFVPVLDLAMVFYILLNRDEVGEITTYVSKRQAEWWGVSVEALKAKAIENTQRNFPAVISTLMEALDENMGGGWVEGFSECQQDECEDEEQVYPLYIVTNQLWFNGAGCFLYDDLLKAFAAAINSDLMILPTSVHEILVIPDDERLDYQSLNEMVRNINIQEVSEEDVLSNQVYRYCRAEDVLEIAAWTNFN